MRQNKTIKELKAIFPMVKGLQVALLYGSFGRSEAGPNSDIDIQILVDNNFQPEELMRALEEKFQGEIQYILEVDLRKKVVVYFKSQPKLEFTVCEKLLEINRNYLCSEITDVQQTILYANADWRERIAKYLQRIVKDYHAEKAAQHQEKRVYELIDKFVYEFESCSTMHRRSDGFQFYFFYNIALFVVVQLNHLSKGETKQLFFPKNFITDTLSSEEREVFYGLKGTMFLPEANQQKRKLLDFFYDSVQKLISPKKQDELTQFLEWIYNRDFLWNFRCISEHNPKIKSGVVYRSSTMTLFQEETFFESFLNDRQIGAVIDLRAEREISDRPYSEDSLSKFRYVKAPMDPWNQSAAFQAAYHHGSNIEIAYRFFSIECKESIRRAAETIINERNATAVHCHAGKDRTGIFISLLHLLSGVDISVAYNDYLASGMDTKKAYLDILLDLINQKGGIVPYLIDCGLQQTHVEQLKHKLLHGN